jgi:hypothetical protein
LNKLSCVETGTYCQLFKSAILRHFCCENCAVIQIKFIAATQSANTSVGVCVIRR